MAKSEGKVQLFCPVTWESTLRHPPKPEKFSNTAFCTKYICRVQSSVWRLPKYWPPTPSPTSECVLPPHQRQGVYTRRAVRGGGGVNILEDARQWIGLLRYNPSTAFCNLRWWSCFLYEQYYLQSGVLGPWQKGLTGVKGGGSELFNIFVGRAGGGGGGGPQK